MSLNLLLEEYLATMKEDRELDALLPTLASAMGHEVVSKPQRGVRQSGVDILTVGVDDDGKRKVFFWVVKCGDIDRAAWSVGPQAVRPSLEELADVFAKTSVPPTYRRLPRKVLVVTNGEFKQEVQQQVSLYLSEYESKHRIETAQVNSARLSAWTEAHLLNEYVLGAERRSLMRRALANVEAPEHSINHARELIDGMLRGINELGNATPARVRKTLSFLRAVAVFNAVLFAWARQADNLEAAYLSAEYTLLAAWANLHASGWIQRKDVQTTYAEYIAHYIAVAQLYHAKVAPYYQVESAFAYALRENTLVVERVFEEIGRIGAGACVLSILSKLHGDDDAKTMSQWLCSNLLSLLQSHTVSASPCYDNQTVDVSCAMAALILNDHHDEARAWLGRLVRRLVTAKQLGRYAPLSTDSFDDLVAIRFEHLQMSSELTEVSTLLPTLALWCQVLGADDDYAWLVQKVAPLFSEATLNTWFAGPGYESALNDPYKLLENGFTLTITLPPNISELSAMLKPVPETVPALEELQAVKYGIPWIAIVAARHWHLQIPHDLVFKICGSA
ncbi:hypothetical protein BOC40_06535 [Burkholderia pseudomallei]|uniref:hypothetical protein n=1 Tax=Burkholderia pseudomallei TaxID=28450 RepID=UPI000A1A1CFE|nr:hypothetical protein [Burkholderia pseudomallei]ARK80118.1 hypothetical protein BOC40_06535 [Burkholderia pseudomallei]ARL46296.1 hypothetical protein BOC50_25370 [Burkholderia pseudomallei]